MNNAEPMLTLRLNRFDLPADAVSTLDSNPHIQAVEPDIEVKVQ